MDTPRQAWLVRYGSIRSRPAD